MLPFATAIALAGCATGRSAGSPPDAGAADGATDGAKQPDAAPVTSPDASLDAPPGCAIAEGLTPSLDGVDDLADYPVDQQLSPGAMLGSDGAAVAWNRSHLFVTVTSSAFTSPYEPLHVYVETGMTLSTPDAAPGKEYSGLVPALPFSPSHLVAVRRVSDSGTGAYDGVFVPGDGWTTRTHALDSSTFVSADQRTISVAVPWSALGGCPTSMRLAWHVVHAQVANEWKDLVPASHTPWQMPGGGYYEIDLTGPLAVASWTMR